MNWDFLDTDSDEELLCLEPEPAGRQPAGRAGTSSNPPEEEEEEQTVQPREAARQKTLSPPPVGWTWQPKVLQADGATAVDKAVAQVFGSVDSPTEGEQPVEPHRLRAAPFRLAPQRGHAPPQNVARLSARRASRQLLHVESRLREPVRARCVTHTRTAEQGAFCTPAWSLLGPATRLALAMGGWLAGRCRFRGGRARRGGRRVVHSLFVYWVFLLNITWACKRPLRGV